jgi:hypothetical protein
VRHVGFTILIILVIGVMNEQAHVKHPPSVEFNKDVYKITRLACSLQRM